MLEGMLEGERGSFSSERDGLKASVAELTRKIQENEAAMGKERASFSSERDGLKASVAELLSKVDVLEDKVSKHGAEVEEIESKCGPTYLCARPSVVGRCAYARNTRYR